MLLNRSRRRKLSGAKLQGGDGVKVPGVNELHSMCSNAHRISRLCSLLGVSEHDQELDELVAVDLNPYIWDVDHA